MASPYRHLSLLWITVFILSINDIPHTSALEARAEEVLRDPASDGPLGLRLSTRDVGGPTPICLYMTTETDWQGEGMNICAVGGFWASGFGGGLTGNVSSAGPEDGVMCRLYDDDDCQSDASAPIIYPGYSDLSQIGFDKRASSFRCWNLCGYLPDLTSSATSVDRADTETESTSFSSTGTLQSVTAGSIAGTIPAFPPSAQAKHHKRGIDRHQKPVAALFTSAETYFYELTTSAKCGPYPTCSARPEVNCANIMATTAVRPGRCPKSVLAPQHQSASKVGEVLVPTVIVETVAGDGGMIIETRKPALVWTTA